MKNYYFLAVLFTALVFFSCQKQKFSDAVLNSTTAGTSDEAQLSSKGTAIVKYGVMIVGPDRKTYFDFEKKVADQLGVSVLRVDVTVPAQNLDTVLVPELYTKYKVLLNFNSPGKGDKVIPFRTDLTQYKKDLNAILNTFTVMPKVAAIENEESNRFYFSGSAMEYINQLKAAIAVMQRRGIKVTNGGITRPGLCLLVYKDFLAQNKLDSAQMFRSWAGVQPDSPAVQGRSRFIDTLLTNYAAMPGLNYVNFHWKGSYPDSTQALTCVINYLKKRTNKNVITNELAQFDYDPNTLVAHVQVCTDNNFPYIIWYSPDPKYGKPDIPLQYSDGTLTPTGIGYKNYLAGK